MLKKTTRSVVLVFVAGGCGGATASSSSGASGNGSVTDTTDGSTTTALPGMTGGTHGTHSSKQSAGGAPNTNATGGALASGTAAGGAYASTTTWATGGMRNDATATQGFAAGNLSKDSVSKGGASGGTRAAGGASGGKGGVAVAGAFNGGGSTGRTGDCVPVCSLYGAPCCLWQTSCLRPTSGCTIDVLAAAVDTTYQYTDLESKVAGLPQDLSASITDQDIAWAAADPWPASRIEIHLTDDAATRHGAVLDRAKDGRVFRVSCAGQSLFVGVFYLIYGAAALDTPVMHFASENGVAVLRLGASQGAWMRGSSTAQCTTPCQRIDQMEMRAAFCRRGVMHELDANARPLDP